MPYLRKSRRYHGSVHPVKFMQFAGCLLVSMSCASQTLANTFYVSTIGNDNVGTVGSSPTTAVRSLTRALVLAEAKGGGTIKMTLGHFDEPSIGMPANIVVEGNWDQKFEKQNAFTYRELHDLKPDEDLCGTYTCIITITSEAADRSITIRKSGVSLKQLVVIGPNRTSYIGSSSYGVVVDGVDASLSHVVIKGGVGGVGGVGDGGSVGHGYCSNGGTGGWVKRLAGSVAYAFCEPQAGGQGESVNLNNRVANGGVGGVSTRSNCSMWPGLLWASTGETGHKGDLGIEGSPGIAAAADAGGFARLNEDFHWASGNLGGRGGNGSAGGGGGGGGPGGSDNVYYACGVGLPVFGGDGHKGSSSGCGGESGGGGHSGGGAFALVVNGGKVSADNLVLFGGQGGAGGKGGDGNVGSEGEVNVSPGAPGKISQHTFWSCTGTKSQGGTGGQGGDGGKGGGGGGGSGGNGGPAFTLVKIGTGQVVNVKDIALGGVFHLSGGKVGIGGKGGLGADSKTVAPSGNEGLHEGEIKLELK